VAESRGRSDEVESLRWRYARWDLRLTSLTFAFAIGLLVALSARKISFWPYGLIWAAATIVWHRLARWGLRQTLGRKFEDSEARHKA
jgi:hypothetical protein